MTPTRAALIQTGMPEVAQRSDLIDRYAGALTTNGLINGAIGGMISETGVWQPIRPNWASGSSRSSRTCSLRVRGRRATGQGGCGWQSSCAAFLPKLAGARRHIEPDLLVLALQ
jgi:hypothetical protein